MDDDASSPPPSADAESGPSPTDAPDPETKDAPGPRRILRSRRDRVIAGVCGGIGDYFDVDPVLVRVAFVALAFAGGVGVLAYLIALLLVPEESGLPRSSREERRAARSDRRRDRLQGGHHTGQVIAILVLIVVASSIVGFHLRGDVGLALVLIAIGAALLWSRTRAPRAAAATDSIGSTDVGAAPRPRTVPVPPSRIEPALAFRPSFRKGLMWGPVAMGGVIAVTGVVALAVGAPVVGAVALAGAAGLVALGAVLGYSRGLVVLAIAASVGLSAAAGVAMPWRGGIGNRTYRPATTADLRHEYRLGIGDLVVDVSGVEMAADTHIDVRVGIGQLTLRVPRGVRVVVNGRAEVGAVSLLGRHDNGAAVDTELTRPGAVGAPTLRVDARVGIGNLQVERPDAGRTATG